MATANSTTLTRKSDTGTVDELGWRRGMLVFKHTTLADAAAEFNRYNPEKIIVADAGCRAADASTARSRPTMSHAFTDAAHAVFGLRSISMTEEIVISR